MDQEKFLSKQSPQEAYVAVIHKSMENCFHQEYIDYVLSFTREELFEGMPLIRKQEELEALASLIEAYKEEHSQEVFEKTRAFLAENMVLEEMYERFLDNTLEFEFYAFTESLKKRMEIDKVWTSNEIMELAIRYYKEDGATE